MSILTSKNELINVTDLDWFHVVDVSDTSSSPQGTSKKIRRGNLFAGYTGFDSRYYTQTEVNNYFSGLAPIVGYNKLDWDNAFAWGDHSTEGYELLSNKGQANGYVPLNASGLIPSQFLPSFIGDVIEYADLASFPATGESGKLYIALDSNFSYRWSGSTYVQIGGGTGMTGTISDNQLAFGNNKDLQGSNDLTFDGTQLNIIGSSTDRYIRFAETFGQFNGAFLQYEGATNKFHMGVHSAADANASNDSKSFTMQRSNGYIGIFNESPAYQLDVNGTFNTDGALIAPTFTNIPNRLSVVNPSFGGSRLGDSALQSPNIDTKALNFKGDSQETIAAMFVNATGTVMTIKGFDDSIMVTDFTSEPAVLGTDPAESTIANSIEFTTGGRYINDQGVQHYPSAGSVVAQTNFQVLQNTGGLARLPYWFGRYDGTTYDEIYTVDSNNVVTFDKVAKGIDGVAPEDFVTKSQLDANGGAVDSVFGRTGSITALATDYDSFYLKNTTDTFTGTLTLDGQLDVTGGNPIRQAPTDNSFNLRTDARTGNGGSLHQYKDNSGTPEAWRESWWDGDSYVTAYANSNSFVFDAPILNKSSSTVSNPNNSGATVSLSWLNDIPRIRIGGNGAGASGAFDIQGAGDVVRASFSSTGDLTIGSRLKMPDTDNYILRENVSNAGMLVGNYSQNTSSDYTAPIFCLGTSFLPNNTTLGNMYGIGYANSSASFLNTTDLGTNPVGWGMYVASDGNARVFFNASNGHGYFGGNLYADNFILSSDKRLKTKIKPLQKDLSDIEFVEFEYKRKKGNKRFGVIAQQVEINHPELIEEDEKGFKQVKYTDLLMAKVAEQSRQIQELQEQVKKLLDGNTK